MAAPPSGPGRPGMGMTLAEALASSPATTWDARALRVSIVSKNVDRIGVVPAQFRGAETVFLSRNPLREVGGLAQFRSLHTLSLAETELALPEDLASLARLPLKAVCFARTPAAREPLARARALACLPGSVETLDGEPVTPEERRAAPAAARRRQTLVGMATSAITLASRAEARAGLAEALEELEGKVAPVPPTAVLEAGAWGEDGDRSRDVAGTGAHARAGAGARGAANPCIGAAPGAFIPAFATRRHRPGLCAPPPSSGPSAAEVRVAEDPTPEETRSLERTATALAARARRLAEQDTRRVREERSRFQRGRRIATRGDGCTPGAVINPFAGSTSARLPTARQRDLLEEDNWQRAFAAVSLALQERAAAAAAREAAVSARRASRAPGRGAAARGAEEAAERAAAAAREREAVLRELRDALSVATFDPIAGRVAGIDLPRRLTGTVQGLGGQTLSFAALGGAGQVASLVQETRPGSSVCVPQAPTQAVQNLGLDVRVRFEPKEGGWKVETVQAAQEGAARDEEANSARPRKGGGEKASPNETRNALETLKEPAGGSKADLSKASRMTAAAKRLAAAASTGSAGAMGPKTGRRLASRTGALSAVEKRGVSGEALDADEPSPCGVKDHVEVEFQDGDGASEDADDAETVDEGEGTVDGDVEDVECVEHVPVRRPATTSPAPRRPDAEPTKPRAAAQGTPASRSFRVPCTSPSPSTSAAPAVALSRPGIQRPWGARLEATRQEALRAHQSRVQTRPRGMVVQPPSAVGRPSLRRVDAPESKVIVETPRASASSRQHRTPTTHQVIGKTSLARPSSWSPPSETLVALAATLTTSPTPPHVNSTTERASNVSRPASGEELRHAEMATATLAKALAASKAEAGVLRRRAERAEGELRSVQDHRKLQELR